MRSGRMTSRAADQALKRLAGAIIEQAAKDALAAGAAGEEARDWLMGEECANLAEFIGLDYRAVRAWVRAGCPKWRKPQNGKTRQKPT